MLHRIDPVLLLLFAGVFVSIGILIFVEWKFYMDNQIFTVVSGIATGFSGAFFTRLMPHRESTSSAPQPTPPPSQPFPPPAQ